MSKLQRRTYTCLALAAILAGLAACGKSAGPDIGTVSPISTPPAAPQAPTVQGTINGGGGAGLRCGEKLEVLDLYEARKAGLQLVATPQSSADAIALVATRIGNHFWNPETIPLPKFMQTLADDLIAPIMEGRPFKNHGTGKEEEVLFVDSLPLSNDYGKYEVPPGCRIEQIAYFSDESTKLSIVKSSWASLDFLSKAFLIAHELFYMMDRREGVERLLGAKTKTSEFSRRFVGRIFAADPLPAKADSLPTDGTLRRCATDGPDSDATYFYAFQNSTRKRTTFIFKTVLGHSSPYQLRADFTGSKSEANIMAVGTSKREGDTRIGVKVARAAKVAKAARSNQDLGTSVDEGKNLTIEFTTVDSGKMRSLAKPQNFTCERF